MPSPLENAKIRVAVVEDDPLMQVALEACLEDHAHVLYPTAQDFLNSPDVNRKWDIFLLDLCHDADPTGHGTMALLPELRSRLGEAELIIQSGISDVETMRACVRAGASRFVLKDHLGDEIPSLISRFVAMRAQKTAIDQRLVGESAVMRRLKKELLALRFEQSADVLIEGETGSGKELCAQSLHVGGPFVAVNVSAIPDELFEAELFGADRGAYTGAQVSRAGLLEAAGSGTLFLDEIQSLAPAHQSKLLRVLETRSFTRVGSTQERPFRARVVSASNQHLRDAVIKGTFREDLYYRLAPLCVQVPSLRVRGADIVLLAERFLQDFDTAGRLSFTDAGKAFLREGYDWPGNVRELRGLVRQLVVKAAIPRLDRPEIEEVLRGNDDPKVSWSATGDEGRDFTIDWSTSLDENLDRLEKHLLQHTLQQVGPTAAREKLGLARSRFYDKLRKHGLSGQKSEA